MRLPVLPCSALASSESVLNDATPSGSGPTVARGAHAADRRAGPDRDPWPAASDAAASGYPSASAQIKAMQHGVRLQTCPDAMGPQQGRLRVAVQPDRRTAQSGPAETAAGHRAAGIQRVPP